MFRDWVAFESFGHLLESQEWIFAKTMPKNPHHYTLRKTWGNDGDFTWAVNYLRENGYREYFGGRPYIQIDVNEYFYWTMGAPIDHTILINKKRKAYPSPYDDIAGDYDALFADADSLAENRAIFDMVGSVEGKAVLDVGCGTGLFLDYAQPADYVGIDTSGRMLDVLKTKHPAALTVNTPLASFVGRRYDLVAALFGTASYVTQSEVGRMFQLTNPGGRVFAMFFAPDYQPVTHEKTGISATFYRHDVDALPGKKTTVNNFVVLDWRNEATP